MPGRSSPSKASYVHCNEVVMDYDENVIVSRYAQLTKLCHSRLATFCHREFGRSGAVQSRQARYKQV